MRSLAIYFARWYTCDLIVMTGTCTLLPSIAFGKGSLDYLVSLVVQCRQHYIQQYCVYNKDNGSCGLSKVW